MHHNIGKMFKNSTFWAPTCSLAFAGPRLGESHPQKHYGFEVTFPNMSQRILLTLKLGREKKTPEGQIAPISRMYAEFSGHLRIRKTREGRNCRFQKAPRMEGGDKVLAVSSEGLPFPVPEIPEIVAFRDSGKILPAIFPGLSRSFPREPPNSQRFRRGVGGRGLATNKPPKRAQKVLQQCVPLLLRGHRKKGTEKRPESLAYEGFFRANPLCPPTPFRTSETGPGNSHSLNLS